MSERQASFFDQAFIIMQTPTRRFDFGIVQHFALGAAPDLAALQAGAGRALLRFPKSHALLQGRWWVPAPNTEVRIVERSCPSDEACRATIADAMSEPFDLRRELAIRQTLMRDEASGRARLLTHVQHALGDFLSIAAWLSVQLGGASPMSETLALKRHPDAKRKSAFAFDKPCDPIRVGRHAEPSARRGFLSVAFDNDAIKASVRAHGQFSFNDLLCSIALQTLQQWNGAGRIGLWLPMNIRQEAYAGFGNGASRIRIYDRATPSDGFKEKAARVREQVRWSREHGEWHAPDLSRALRRWPQWLIRLGLRAFARRPGVDYATTTFSHIETIGPVADAQMWPGVERIEALGNLYGGHTLGFAAIGFAGKTYVSFTWDEALYGAEDVARFVALFEDNRLRAFAELSP